MSFSKFAVKRPVTTTMVLLIVVAFGILSIMDIKLDMMPNMDIPIAIVSTSYNGAGPEEIENLITSRLESAIGTVAGVKEISSSSSYGSSIVIVQFEDNTDINFAALDLRERIDMVKAALPDDATDPMVIKIDINSMTSMTLGITAHNGDLVELKRIVDEKIVNRLERQDGVASVSVSGGRDTEIEVVLHEDKLRGFGVQESAVTQLLMTENLNTPTGSVKQGEQTLSLRVQGEFDNLEDIKNIPITTATGSMIYLQDIADVQEVYKDMSSASYINGEPSVSVTIQKQSTANTVNVSDAVLKELAKLENDFPNLTFTMLLDPADYIRMSLSTVASSAVQGALLAAVVLYVFLRNFRSTLIVATSIPISIIATFVLMYYTNITLNILSLGGLALGIGMLVDNSIVVMESIFRKMERGEDKITAAIEGAREVAMSVIASTLTTIAVFLPITFTGGLTAQIFNQLAMTITFSLVSSLAIALTFVPMACSVILTMEDAIGTYKRNNILVKAMDKISDGIDALRNVYEKLLHICLRRRGRTYLVVAAFILVTFVSLAFVGIEFMPESDEGMITVSIAMPKGTVLEVTEAKAMEVADRILTGDFPEIEDLMLSVGGGGISLTGSSTDSATVMMTLKDRSERRRSSDEVARAISKELYGITNAEITAQAVSMSMGSYGGAGVDVNIMGDDLDTLARIANDMVGIFESIEGTREVTTSLEDATPQATIRVNRVKASSYGITSYGITSIINTAVSGSVATTYKIDGDEYDIRIRQDKGNFEYITDIQNILIPTATGANIPLYELATVEIQEIPVSISRSNQQRYVSVSALLDGTDTGSVSRAFSQAMTQYAMPDNYTWAYTGTMEQLNETFGSLGLALIMAVLLVYMIMAAEFESLIYPFIVMFSMPIAMTGGLTGLILTGQKLSITGFLGLIMLAGIVVNNAIVLVDYINFLIRERGKDIDEALKMAGPIRMRPILMTTLTTVLALVPMLFSTADGSEMMKGLSAVIVFGLSLSTLVTLIFIPCLYLTFHNRKMKHEEKKANRRKLKEQKAN